MKLKLIILTSMMAIHLQCKKESNEVDRELNQNKIQRPIAEEIAARTDPSFSLSKYPEMKGIFTFKEAKFNFVEKYFATEVRLNGKKNGDVYVYEEPSNCAEISNATNTFRFRYSGENFDLHLKFISKDGNDYFLTNSSRDQLLQMKILDIGKHYKSNIVQALEYDLLTMNNEKVAHGIIYTDFKSYEECLKERGAIAESIKGMSKDDLGP